MNLHITPIKNLNGRTDLAMLSLDNEDDHYIIATRHALISAGSSYAAASRVENSVRHRGKELCQFTDLEFGPCENLEADDDAYAMSGTLARARAFDSLA